MPTSDRLIGPRREPATAAEASALIARREYRLSRGSILKHVAVNNETNARKITIWLRKQSDAIGTNENWLVPPTLMKETNRAITWTGELGPFKQDVLLGYSQDNPADGDVMSINWIENL